MDDWDELALDARRALIRAVIERVSVAPGSGADRVTIEPQRSAVEPATNIERPSGAIATFLKCWYSALTCTAPRRRPFEPNA
ncbi:MAG: hypothetical protein JO321_08555 [Solirubrobacterales bacterium]|nr:hypothetical protein [Solirubrobacterales bacterium]MBV8941326.1 hypothetical protein [Solirubrobacterales bacterium]MBV9167497.1 hypothetical protein [Solirubrobacterales bacterium]MBV9535445.1 hypothetical protein [Solirubrobacterales bacterium]